MKTVALVVGRALALTFVYLILFATITGIFVSVPPQDAATVNASNAGVALLAVSLLNTLTIMYPIARARWVGWKLIGAIFLALFGVATFMSQIETAAFSAVANRLPKGMLQGLVLAGFLLALLFSPVAALAMGKLKGQQDNEPNERLQMPLKEWLWKLGIIIVAYEFLYLTFGYYVAWKNPAVQAYYGGTDPGSFILQLQSIWRDTPWLFPFQALRALLWTAIALPIIRMMKGKTWETAFAIGLIFAVLATAQLLLPNPYMPRDVRMTHLVETATSNFIFGLIMAGLLLWRHQKPS